MITRLESSRRGRNIMESLSDRLRNPYMTTLNMTISQYLKIYNMAIIGLPKSDRYDLTRSNWTIFTNISKVLYAHFYSKYKFRFSHPRMEAMYLLNSRMSYHIIYL